MHTDQFTPLRPTMSVLIAVDLEPTDAGVRRISGEIDEFSAQHTNGGGEPFSAPKEHEESRFGSRADPMVGFLSA